MEQPWNSDVDAHLHLQYVESTVEVRVHPHIGNRA